MKSRLHDFQNFFFGIESSSVNSRALSAQTSPVFFGSQVFKPKRKSSALQGAGGIYMAAALIKKAVSEFIFFNTVAVSIRVKVLIDELNCRKFQIIGNTGNFSFVDIYGSRASRATDAAALTLKAQPLIEKIRPIF